MAFKIKDWKKELGEAIGALTIQKKMVLLKQKDKVYRVWAEPDYLYLIDLKVNVFSAVCCKYDKDTETYEIDYDLYIFYDPKTGKEIYSEIGSSIEVCILNYCRTMNLHIKDVDDIYCFYFLDNGKFLKEKVLNECEHS